MINIHQNMYITNHNKSFHTISPFLNLFYTHSSPDSLHMTQILVIDRKNGRFYFIFQTKNMPLYQTYSNNL